MAEIFVSYARQDKEFVRLLCAELKRRNRDAWIDTEDIVPSAEWRREILEAIEQANTVIQILSPYSAKSKVCVDEIAYAVKNNKRIIPILRADVNMADLPDAVRDRQWVFIRETDDFQTGITDLLRALDTNIEWVRAHTRLLVRALEWERHNRDSSYTLRGLDLRKAEAALASSEELAPRLIPLQIEYALASRRAVSRRVSIAAAAGTLGVLAVIVFGGLYFISKRESALNLAADFREKGVSELENNDPLAAEIFFTKSLSTSDSRDARERLIEARARSPRLLWMHAPENEKGSMLAISGDSLLFAVATELEVSIWSVVERRQIRTFRSRANSAEGRLAAFGSSHRLFALGSANRVDVWDLRSNSEQPIETVTTHGDISSLSISPDGSLLIAGEADGTIVLWKMDGRSNTPILKLSGHTDRITGTVVNANNTILVSGSWDETARVWDLQTGNGINTFEGHDDAVLCVAISPDGDLVASAGWDDTIWIWDRRIGKGIRALTGHKGGISSLAFSADGKRLVSGSEDRTARLWEVEKGRHLLTFPGHSGEVSFVAFLNSDGEDELVTADSTRVVRLWDLSSIGQRDELATLRGHQRAVTMIDFDPGARLLASSSVDKSIDLWDLRTGKIVRAFRNLPNQVSAVAFSPDGRRLASATKKFPVQIWNIESGEGRALGDLQIGDNIRHIVFSPSGEQLVGGGDDGKIRVWNIERMTLDKQIEAHTAKIQGLAFSSDGSLLASSSEDKTIKLWNTKEWKLERTLIGHLNGVYEISFSSDGKLLLSGSDDRTVRLWNVTSGKEIIKPIDHNSPVWAVSFAANGKYIASGTEDSAVRVWSVSGSGTGISLLDEFVLRICGGAIWWLKFHSSSTDVDLGIASEDKTVRVLHMNKLRSLFSNSSELAAEAAKQSGLVVGSGPDGTPQIEAIKLDNIKPD
jgi:WD40 repeat protein